MVISFKNHTLDDFLEELLNLGVVPDVIVRLGSKSTLRTASLLLHQRHHPRTADTRGIIVALEPEVEALSQELQKAFVNFNRASIS